MSPSEPPTSTPRASWNAALATLPPLPSSLRTSILETAPWTAPLLPAPGYVYMPVPSRERKASTEDEFFARTIASDETVELWASFVRASLGQEDDGVMEGDASGNGRLMPATIPRETSSSSPSTQPSSSRHSPSSGSSPAPPLLPPTDAYTLLSLSKGLNGHPNILHGGVAASLLDEIMGVAQARITSRACFTAWLTAQYKAPVPTPRIVCVGARIVRREGRKCWMEGWIVGAPGEDGKAKVLVTGESLYVESREKL